MSPAKSQTTAAGTVVCREGTSLLNRKTTSFFEFSAGTPLWGREKTYRCFRLTPRLTNTSKLSTCKSFVFFLLTLIHKGGIRADL